MTWAIVGGPVDHAEPGYDGRGWLWELRRGEAYRRVFVQISRNRSCVVLRARSGDADSNCNPRGKRGWQGTRRRRASSDDQLHDGWLRSHPVSDRAAEALVELAVASLPFQLDPEVGSRLPDRSAFRDFAFQRSTRRSTLLMSRRELMKLSRRFTQRVMTGSMSVQATDLRGGYSRRSLPGRLLMPQGNHLFFGRRSK